MTAKPVKVLCYLDHYVGRDVEIMLPLVIYMQEFLNCEVEFVLIYDIFAIYRKKPDIVLTTNITGSSFHYRIAKYAAEQNIKVFAVFSEGNFATDDKFNYFGYNTDRIFFQEYVCCWSKRVRDYLRKYHPNDNNRIVLTGASGMDRYSIYDFQDKEAYLRKKGLEKFEKVVGYAAWGFGKIHNKFTRQQILNSYGGDESKLEELERQRVLVESVLRELIENNQDVLFILKKHPQETMPSSVFDEPNEINALKDYPNVLYIREDEDIHDILSVSDIWLGYKSNSAIESWAMDPDKPTIFINPEVPSKESIITKGCLITRDFSTANDYLKEFYDTGKINAFFAPELVKNRQFVIHESVGYVDGLNHLRIMYYFKRTLKELQQKGSLINRKINFKYLVMWLMFVLGKPFYNKFIFSRLPKFKKTVWVFERSKMDNLYPLIDKYSRYIKKFYKDKNIDKLITDDKYLESLIEKTND